MNRQIVTLNAGSSSVKFGVFDEDGCPPTPIASGLAQSVGGARHMLVRNGAGAVLDTAFHRGHPFVHDVFALPRSLYRDGVRRYGFHGLSYESVSGGKRPRPPSRFR